MPARLALIMLWLALHGCADPRGEQYADVDAIGMSETWEDWVIIGSFGASAVDQGPFTLTDIKYCEVSEPCSFSHRGQGHTYNKFFGYELAVLRLENSSGKIAHVVLRSAEKIED